MGLLILDDGGKNMWVGAEGACSGDEGENVAGDNLLTNAVFSSKSCNPSTSLSSLLVLVQINKV